MDQAIEMNDFLTPVNVIAFALILVCALSGAAAPYVKGEKEFHYVRYLVDVVTSCAAGFIVFLIVRTTTNSWEWTAASSGISAYFGIKIMNVLYHLFTGKIKLSFVEHSQSNSMGGRHEN